MIYASVPAIQSPADLEASWTTWDVGPELLVVDNTTDREWRDLALERGWRWISFGTNLGVPAAWNVARADFLGRTQAPHDLLLLLSSSVVWDDGLAAAMHALNREAGWQGCQTHLGPHAIAWSRAVFEQVGSFDESPFPGYYSDNDWFYRCILGGVLDGMARVELNASCEDGRTIRELGMTSNTSACLEWYCNKWGGEPSKEKYTTPFDSGLPTWWTSPVYRPGMQNVNLGESRFR